MRLSFRLTFTPTNKPWLRPAEDASREILLQSPPVILADDIEACHLSHVLLEDSSLHAGAVSCMAPPFMAYCVDTNCMREANNVDSVHIAKVFDLCDPKHQHDRELLNCGPEAKWSIRCHLWQSLRNQPINGRIFYGGFFMLTVASDGTFLSGAADGTNALQSDDYCERLRYHILLHGLILSFFHCRNVKKLDVTKDHSPSDKKSRRLKLPHLKFTKLDIKPFEEQVELLIQSGEEELAACKRALHLVRGHFADYKPEAPLFGKVPGRFWKPMHLRGKLEAGMISKRYNIRT